MSTNFSMRKSENQVDSVNPLSHRIVDVDCAYESGKFIVKSLPSVVPGLFTIRFTAPADYAAGNVIVVKGKDLPVRTPGMATATSDIFKAGAVIHCDIDMDRELAFLSGGLNQEGCCCPFQDSEIVCYVSPSGSDALSTPGTSDAPFRSVTGALAILSQKVIPSLAGDIIVKIEPGNYAMATMNINAGCWSPKNLYLEAVDPMNKPILTGDGRLNFNGGNITCRNIRFETTKGVASFGTRLKLVDCHVKAATSGLDVLGFYYGSHVIVENMIEIDCANLSQRVIVTIGYNSSLYIAEAQVEFKNVQKVTVGGFHPAWNSSVDMVGTRFIGTMEGRKFNAFGSSVLRAMNVSNLPGDSEGVADLGSAYRIL